MVKFQELKIGDSVIVENEGDRRRGDVTQLNGNEKQVCVDNGTQEFWYETDQVFPLQINEEALGQLKFHKHVNEGGSVKYAKGAFRILIPAEGDFTRMEIWYRDEKRHILHEIPLHMLQNHFYEMTKVHLNEDVFD